MKIVDAADQIWRNLDSPTDSSISSIAAWLRFNTNLGKLNDLINKGYTIDSNLEIIDRSGNEIDSGEIAIYELIYNVNYFERQIKKFLGAGSVDVMILQEATSDNGTLRFVNRNEIAKSFIQVKKDKETELGKLVNNYKFSNSRASQVTGDDESVTQTSSRLPTNSIAGIANNVIL